ncbi:putative thioredoxin reductase 1, cytoplasmic, partial [Apostichopus japonicus]
QHNWDTLKNAVQDHIGSLNWNYRVQLRDKSVTYINGYAEFTDRHTIKTVNKRNKVQTFKAEKILLATGMRPRYPDIPGVKEFAITSDDLFSLRYCPGKTLTIGASYVSLECAGFLTGMGLDVTVMVRSILLRGFDQQMADMIGTYMEKHGTHFLRKCVPTRCDYINVPTTVFTPLEYGAIGYSEEDATDTFGEDNIEVYHAYFQPLEYTVAHRDEAGCYGKIICNKADGDRVVGFHILGPNAGEITQGYAVAMKCGATKEHFDTTIGIHPTCSEVFTTMDVTKASGLDVTTTGC